MSAFRQLMDAKASNWALCLTSASLLAVAFSNGTRPAPVSAQAGGADSTRRATTGQQKAVLNTLEDAFVNIADKVEPSVVTISASAKAGPERPVRPMQDMDDRDLPDPLRDLFRRGGPGQGPDDSGAPRRSTGSGVIIRETGNTVYILTNNHVVSGRDKFNVQMFDSTDLLAELVGTDERTDLAVLKCRLKRPLPAGTVARLGDSERVKPGQWAIAIGSPLGYKSSLTVGVISAKGRRLGEMDRTNMANYSDLIQTDASINPGNSGGPLVNIDGEVVGINVAIASSGMSRGSIGIGFAIPVNTAKMVSEQLISTGKVVRGYLGVSVSDTNRSLAPELREHLNVPNGGALVEGVQPEGPAGRGGLKDGDVIVRLNDQVVTSFDDLEKAVAGVRPGTTVPVEVVRDRRPVRLNVTVVQRPDERNLLSGLNRGAGPDMKEPAAAQPTKTKFGLTVRPAETGSGVQIVSVAPGSAADDAGLRPGDVVLQAGNASIANIAAFQKALDTADNGTGLVLRVRSTNGIRFVVLKP